ncbi:purine-cytosine permease [Echria macrotheca]|uniref:Purine-cytosine permease n=1 Tax=Echria macrotheca TaxID=438768 RepID=A0AAJ0BGR4_9PEZI|nr:purine-cytosine permease [Echria macrotheca]
MARPSSHKSNQVVLDEEIAIADIGPVYGGGTRDVELSAGHGVFAKIQQYVARIGVEKRGIERVPDTLDERTDRSMIKVATMWTSSAMAVACFAVGTTAQPVFGLGFLDSVLVLFFFNVLGVLPTAFLSTFGPAFGLRQLVLSRFFFGWHGVKIYAFLNVLTCVGWSTVFIVLGGQLFHTINSDIPGWAGMLVIAFATLVPGLFGYKAVLAYQQWAWIPMLIVYLIVLGEFARSGEFDPLLPMNSGPAEAGAVLSFGSTVFSVASSLCTYASDYTTYQPSTISRRRLFAWSFGGMIVPLLFLQTLGAAIGTATTRSADFARAWEEAGAGGLLGQVLIRLGGFGTFCLVLLAIGIVANNCPNVYSVSFGIQLFAPNSTGRVPRFLWTLLGVCIAIGLAVPAYDNFAPWLENFLVTTAYWFAIYQGIAFTEHFIFRRGFDGYQPSDYDSPDKLPVGWAASAAFVFGVAGCVLGMTQLWWTGPVGRLAGGDLGFELAFGFSALSYVILRYFELNRVGR